MHLMNSNYSSKDVVYDIYTWRLGFTRYLIALTKGVLWKQQLSSIESH